MKDKTCQTKENRFSLLQFFLGREIFLIALVLCFSCTNKKSDKNKLYGLLILANSNKSTAGVTVTTLAGSGSQGSIDGNGTVASFYNPIGIALDSNGLFYVTDTNSRKIRKITSTGIVSTFAGSGSQASTDGSGIAASFYGPLGITLDSNGNVFVSDSGSHLIRKITSGGIVTTFVGSGSSGSTDGTGTAASFNLPVGMALDSVGTIFLADTDNHKIRKITSAGVVTTFAGSGSSGSADGTGTAASFNRPSGLALDSNGTLYVADSENNKIRKITSAGVVTTFAGSGSSGSTDGTGAAASFNFPRMIAIGSSGTIYVSDTNNHKIRKITSTGVVTTIAGTGSMGSTDGYGTAASFNLPWGMIVDINGIVYIADSGNNKIRKITF